MDIVRNAQDHGQSASPDASIEAALASLVDVYGLAILRVPDQIKLRLAQAQPDAQRQIDAVLSALAANVPQMLRKAHDDDRLNELLPQLAERVGAQGSLDAATASWAVRAWAHALALPTTSLAKATRPQQPSVAHEFAAVVKPLSREPTVAVGNQLHNHDTESQIRSAVSEQVANENRVRPPSVPEHLPTPPIDTPFEADEPAPVVASAIVAPAIASATVAPVAAPATVAPAVAPGVAAAVVAAQDVPATGPAADAVEPYTPLPPEPPRRSRAPTGRRTLVIGAALVVIVLAIFFGVDGTRWLATRTTATQSPTQARVQPPAQRDSSIADATARGSQRTTANPAPETSSSSAPTTNARQASEPAAGPPKPDAPSTEPRAPASAAPLGTAVGTPISAPTSTPTSVQRPTIKRVDVPRAVVGAPFTVAIRVDIGANAVAAVERKVVDGSAALRRTSAVTTSTGLRRSKNGALLVPFKAIAEPSYATIEFTVVNRDGLRSEPRRATLTVAAAPAVAASYCTRTTCGAVVAVRELDAGPNARAADRGAKMYEVIIRMDDRTIHKATVSEYWSKGTGVQMVGGRFVAMNLGQR